MGEIVAINKEIAEFIVAIGLGGFISALVQVLKFLRVIPDGTGGTAYTVLSVIAFVVLAVLGTFGVNLEGETAKSVFEVLALLGQLVGTILSGFLTFNGLRSANVKGFRPRSN